MTASRTTVRAARQKQRATLRAAHLLSACTLFFGMTGVSAAADASGATTQKSSLPRELAKQKYEQGVEAYRDEKYADAVRMFLEADALSPSAALSYNIARAYEKVGDDAQALRWYRNYVRLNPSAPNLAEVQHFVSALSEGLARKGIQQVTVLSVPSGTTVAIDGKALGVTPLTVELRPGKHRASLSLRGFSDAERNFDLPALSAIDLSLALEKAPVIADAHSRRFGIAPYLTLGVGAALLSASAVFEVARRSAQSSAHNDITQLDYEHDYNAANSRQSAARVLLGVGSAVTIAGAALLFFNTRLTPVSSVGALRLPGGGALLAEHRF